MFTNHACVLTRSSRLIEWPRRERNSYTMWSSRQSEIGADFISKDSEILDRMLIEIIRMWCVVSDNHELLWLILQNTNLLDRFLFKTIHFCFDRHSYNSTLASAVQLVELLKWILVKDVYKLCQFWISEVGLIVAFLETKCSNKTFTLLFL